jgi:hypothetical protein
VVVVATATPALTAYGRTGERLWSVQAPDIAATPPIRLSDDALLASYLDGSLAAHDIRTGRVLWTAHVPGPIRLPPSVDGDRVVVADTSRSVRWFDITTGRTLGAVVLASAADQLAACGGAIVVHAGSTVTRFHPAEPSHILTRRLKHKWLSTHCIGGTLVVRSSGQLSAWKPDGLTPLWEVSIDVRRIVPVRDGMALCTASEAAILTPTGSLVTFAKHQMTGNKCWIAPHPDGLIYMDSDRSYALLSAP